MIRNTTHSLRAHLSAQGLLTEQISSKADMNLMVVQLQHCELYRLPSPIMIQSPKLPYVSGGLSVIDSTYLTPGDRY